MHEIAIASRSGIGARQRNEDYLQHGEFDRGWYAVLSDGAGGHRDGATAADLVVRMLVHGLASGKGEGAAIAACLAEAVHAANAALNDRQVGQRGTRRMHATLVVLWIDRAGREATWAHVGDSRLYRLRRGRVAEVTRDDTVVQQLLDAGLVTHEQAREHGMRHQLVAAMGLEEPIDPHVSTPGFPVDDGDAFLLCSDGWHERLAPAEIEDCLLAAADVEAWLDAMQQLVVERRTPSQDNFSAIAVWVGGTADITRAAPLET